MVATSLLGEPGNFLQIIVQTTFSYVALLLITRALGKKQMGQLTLFHYITGITIGSLAASVSIDRRASVWDGLTALGTWTVYVLLTAGATLRFRNVRRWFTGEPTAVVENGKIQEAKLHRLQYNIDDLMSQLRAKGAFRLADVEFAILEPTGELSVLFKSQQRPLVPADLGIPTRYEGLASGLVVDGKVSRQNLKRVHVSEEWLMARLTERGIFDVAEVVYAELDSQGGLYIDVKQDGSKGTPGWH